MHRGIYCRNEPERFTFPVNASAIGVTCYIPDFKLEIGRHTMFIETKGYPDRVSKEKARLMAVFYPHVRIYTVGWEKYKLIEKYYRNKVPNWE